MTLAIAKTLDLVRPITHWDERYLDLAEFVAGWSKDPSTQVGAVITKNNYVVSVGFNGLPRGVEDTKERLNNRDIKYKMIVHGEINAMHAAKRDLTGCTLYTHPFMPCTRCAGEIIQAGIVEVVSRPVENERWAADFAMTQGMFAEAGVTLILIPKELK
jgi:dCMP deaminase